MMTNEMKFPRIDLARYRASAVSLLSVLNRDDATVELFETLLRENEFLSVTKYQRSKTPHLLSESVVETDDGGFLINIEYRADEYIPAGPVPKSLRREGELLTRLSKRAEPSVILCHVDMQFGNDDEETSPLGSLFPLPMPIGAPPSGIDSPVDEIRGIRGVKRKTGGADEDLEYYFILDRPGNGPVFLSVNFELNERLNARLPARILQRATNVAAMLGMRGAPERSRIR